MTENVWKHPGEPKYRQIKAENKVFKAKMEDCPAMLEVLLALGWAPGDTPDGESVWILGDGAVSTQDGNLKRLREELVKLRPIPKSTSEAVPVQPGSMPGGMFGGMPSGMPGGMPAGMPAGLPGAIPPDLQAMMQDPNIMAQAQQMMQNPAMMAQIQQMMGGGR